MASSSRRRPLLRPWTMTKNTDHLKHKGTRPMRRPTPKSRPRSPRRTLQQSQLPPLTSNPPCQTSGKPFSPWHRPRLNAPSGLPCPP